MASVPVWYVDARNGEVRTLRAYISDRFTDGKVVDASELAGADLSGEAGTWEATVDAVSGDVLTVDPHVGPPLWFVEDRQPEADPPTTAVIAFSSHHFPAGMVITNDEFEGMPVHNQDQVGAVTWWPSTGQIKELYVQPEFRRLGVAQAMIWVGAAFQVAGDRPRLWGGGDRTDLGEAFAQAQKVQQRVAPRRSVVAPMTPEHRRSGVPERNLYPDT